MIERLSRDLAGLVGGTLTLTSPRALPLAALIVLAAIAAFASCTRGDERAPAGGGADSVPAELTPGDTVAPAAATPAGSGDSTRATPAPARPASDTAGDTTRRAKTPIGDPAATDRPRVVLPRPSADAE